MLKIGKLKQEQNEVMLVGHDYDPMYVIAENLDLDRYQDITSNQLWIDVGRLYYDYKFIRSQIQYRSAVVGFSNLDKTEQRAAAITYSVAKTDRDMILSEAEQLEAWKIFMEESSECRKKRWADTKNYISYYLAPADSLDLAESTNILSNNFLIYGIENFGTDGIVGLFDWLENTGIYATNGDGYNSKIYYNETHKNNMMLILTTGKY